MDVLAGDIGGTNTRLAIYRSGESEPLLRRSYRSQARGSLEEIAIEFLEQAAAEIDGGPPHVGCACIGIAGPVVHNVGRATNLPWVVDGGRLGQRLSIPRVKIVNDFVAIARSVAALAPEHLAGFGGGPPEEHGPIAVLGPGTGLGEAFLTWSSSAGRYRVLPSEGGHADFAPRTPLEAALMQCLGAKYGRVSNERVLSGNGLRDIFAFLSDEPALRALVSSDTRSAMADGLPEAVIVERATAGSDPVCQMALSMFASVLGAVAGNLALTILATGGVFVAGGIAPRIVDYLRTSGLRDAFEQKGRLRPLVAGIPLWVITHPEPGLLGAAEFAFET